MRSVGGHHPTMLLRLVSVVDGLMARAGGGENGCLISVDNPPVRGVVGVAGAGAGGGGAPVRCAGEPGCGDGPRGRS